MENKISFIKDRVLQIIDNKNISKTKFFEQIGMTSANFRGKAKETPLNSTTIENIITLYPDICAEWLITGNGSMFKSEAMHQGQTSLACIECAEKDKEIMQLKRVISNQDELLDFYRSEREVKVKKRAG